MLVTLPAIDWLFQDVEWTLRIPQQKNRSEFTNTAQVIGTPGAELWVGDADALPPGNITELRLWTAFILSCRGGENTFRMPAAPLPQYAGAQPTVTAAVAGNRAVTLSSTAPVAIGMKATVKQANGHHRLVGIVGKDASNVYFEPYLTSNPAIGQTLEIADPYALVRLADPNQRLPTIRKGFRLAVEEAL